MGFSAALEMQKLLVVFAVQGNPQLYILQRWGWVIKPVLGADCVCVYSVNVLVWPLTFVV